MCTGVVSRGSEHFRVALDMPSIVRAVMTFAKESTVVAPWWADLLARFNNCRSFKEGFV